MPVRVSVNIFLGMEQGEQDITLSVLSISSHSASAVLRRTDSYWDGEEAGGPTAGLVQPGRLYSYSTDEVSQDLMNERRLIQCLACMQDEVCTTAPLRLRHSRFVSRIAAERLVERLDLDQFRPVMTSERRPGRGKREWQQPEPDQGKTILLKH